MIDFIKGNIEYLGEDYVVIENNGIGYKVYTSAYTMSELNKKREDVIIYTQMIVREDDISLCGFASRNELKLFQLLTTVNGVGTKVAIGILSSIPYLELANIIMGGDAVRLTRVQGVGKKTAQRIILELKDKVSKKIELTNIEYATHDAGNIGVFNENNEVIDALLALGYSKSEVQNILYKIDKTSSVEDMIKQALKLLAK